MPVVAVLACGHEQRGTYTTPQRKAQVGSVHPGVRWYCARLAPDPPATSRAPAARPLELRQLLVALAETAADLARGRVYPAALDSAMVETPASRRSALVRHGCLGATRGHTPKHSLSAVWVAALAGTYLVLRFRRLRQRWGTFSPHRVCPRCRCQWTQTRCRTCQRWSAHEDWYG